MSIATTNPATGETMKRFEPLSSMTLDEKLARSSEAFRIYRRTTFSQRAKWMERAADIMEAEADRLATAVTLEMGKTLSSARAEVTKCALGARFYARQAESFLADEHIRAGQVNATQAFTHWQPLGPVLAVMPWNYPLWQTMRFVAPTLMAGNVGLLKHASNVPQCALNLEDVMLRAGFPEGVFQTLLITTSQVERVITDPRVTAVTLTGSEGAGRAVGLAAGGAIKKSVLELGGNDAFIVLPSADLDRAAAIGVASRCQNNGQSCVAAKRFILHEVVAETFRELFLDRMRELVVGDPMQPVTDIGPLATQAGQALVEELVDDALSKGATPLLGGQRVSGPGWFYEPTVLADLTPEMRIFEEEVFGPVAQIYVVPNLDAALELANITSLGLSSSAWTTHPEEQQRLITDLEAGSVFINGMSASYPELPFGGIKNSGHGRELAAMGIKEFCNAKTIWVST